MTHAHTTSDATRMQVDLSGKVAVVTGGARDIGRATSLDLARNGAAVVVNFNTSADKARAVCDEIRAAGGRAVAVKADVTKSDDIKRLAEEASAAFGRIHILVNNAGGLLARKALGEMDMAFWDEVMHLNLRSVAFVTQALLPHMADGGAIVNLSSLAARDGGGPGSTAYAAAKGGVLTLTRGLSKELASRKIRVNCVSPGMIDTTFHDTFTKPEARKATAARTTVGREGTSSDVASAIVFLASDASSYINGESIEINGGLYYI
jgi:3-oxoacyl-[acyl-carrier protein] reductase